MYSLIQLSNTNSKHNSMIYYKEEESYKPVKVISNSLISDILKLK